ncbi:hypothetical protein ACFL2O_10450 [Thermodesulfobacteriota bacterium]
MMAADKDGRDADLYLSDKTCALLMLNKEERKLIKELLTMSLNSASIKAYIGKKMGEKYILTAEKLLNTLGGVT